MDYIPIFRKKQRAISYKRVIPIFVKGKLTLKMFYINELTVFIFVIIVLIT